MSALLRVAALAICFLVSGLHAQPAEVTPDAPEDAAARFLASLQFQRGTVSVEGADAVLALDTDFAYLGARDARRVLEELWGNPPDATVLGMVVPDAPRLDEAGSWAVVVTHSSDGYVSDEDAASIDYDALLAELREGTREENAFRRQEGYPTVELVGWATPPHYDAVSKKLHWAKELAFEGTSAHTVNYDVRVLGRRGYLSLNAVASRADLATVEAGMERLIPATSFAPGERYADFDPATDKIAAYGIAALIGGTLAAKAGFFGKLFAALLAAKKIVIPLLIGGIALLGRLFRRGERAPKP